MIKKVDKFGNIIYTDNKGRLHRKDGPAVEFNGDKYWYKNGMRHREDGPAVEYLNGNKEWYKNDLLHREDGPAVEYFNNSISYWYEGELIKECDSVEYLKKWIKLRVFR